MKKLLLLLLLPLMAQGQSLTIPGSQFPVVSTPSNDYRFLLVNTNGNTPGSSSAFTKSNATVTYSDLAFAITNSLSTNLNSSKLDRVSGTASNLTVTADTSTLGPDTGALNVHITGANPGAENIAVVSSTNEITAAVIHMFTYNTNGLGAKAVDFGLWSDGFGDGSGYNGTFGFDAYNTNAASLTLLPPNFGISMTDGRDGAVIRHPLLFINATNLSVSFLYRTNDSRETIPGFTWDGRGIKSFHTIASTNLAPLGTVSGTGTTITGVGTRFGSGPFGQAGFGDEIAVGSTSYHVKTTPSDTSATIFENAISPTFTGSNYQVFTAGQTWYSIDGVTPVAAITADGTLMIKKSGDGAFMRFVGSTKNYQFNEGGSGEWILYNVSDNTIPMIITSSGSVTFSGTVTDSASIIKTSSSCPVQMTGSDVIYWNSNMVLYGSSATKTNVISDLR